LIYVKKLFSTVIKKIRFLIPFLLTLIFLYIAFYDVNFGNVMELATDVSILWMIVFSFVILLSHYIRALRWKIILYSVKKETKILNLFNALIIGYAVNNVVPRLGEVSRAVIVGKMENLSRTSMLGSIILERVIDLIFLALAIIISLALWDKGIYEHFQWLKFTLYFFIIFFIVGLFVLFLVISYKEKFINLIKNFIIRFSEKAGEKIAYILDKLLEGFLSLKGTSNYILVLLLSGLIMIIYALGSYFGFFMLNINDGNFLMAWVLMSISAIGVVIPTPGGTGSYHTIAKSVLVLLFGFNEEISLAYAFLTHIIGYFLVIILGAVLLYYLSNRFSSDKTQKESLFKEITSEKIEE